jgi:hypothetical protein
MDSSDNLFYAPPDMPICDALHELFSHYCSPWRTGIINDSSEAMLDSASFTKLCKDAPGLESKRMDRHEFDIVFTKVKPQGCRRLDFEHFLNALAELAYRKYPDDEPRQAFAKLLSKSIFGLFDQQPVRDNTIVDNIRRELE